MNQQELFELARKAKEGDKDAFEAICRHKAADYLYICTRLMGNKQDGEDAAQEVFLRMQKNLHSLKNPHAFTAWANRIINTTCMQMLRQRSQQKQHQPFDINAEGLEDLQSEFLPQDFAEEAEKRQVVLEALEGLTFKNRRVLVLFYYEGLSTKEIAQALDITPKAAERALHYARGALKKRVGKRLSLEIKAGKKPPYSLGGTFVLTRILRADAVQNFSQESAERIAALGAAGVSATAAGAAGATAAVSGAAFSAPLVATVATAAILTSAAILVSPLSTPPVTSGAVPRHVIEAGGGVAQGSEIVSYLGGEDILLESIPHTSSPSSGAQSLSSAPASGGSSPSAPPEGPGGSPKPGTSLAHVSTWPQSLIASSTTTTTNSTLPRGDSSISQTEPSGGASVSSVPPSSSEKPPQSQPTSTDPGEIAKTVTYTGKFQFTHANGALLDTYNYMAQGFTVTVYQNSQKVARAAADSNGAYSFTLQDPHGAYTLRASTPYGYGPIEEESFSLTFTADVTQLAPLPFTDTLAPAALLYLYEANGTQLKTPVNPASASVIAYDATPTTVRWLVLDSGNQPVHQATGQSISLAFLAGQDGSYTLQCTVTDSAGNQTVAGRDFVIS